MMKVERRVPRMRGLLLLTANESHWINCLQWGEDKFPNRKECGTHGGLLLSAMRKLECQTSQEIANLLLAAFQIRSVFLSRLFCHPGDQRECQAGPQGLE
jgi:hypothetical protein